MRRVMVDAISKWKGSWALGLGPCYKHFFCSSAISKGRGLGGCFMQMEWDVGGAKSKWKGSWRCTKKMERALGQSQK